MSANRQPSSQPPPLVRVLSHPAAERLFVRFDRDQVAQGCHDVLEELRRAMTAGRDLDPVTMEAETILSKVEARLGGLTEAGLQRVVNATGIVHHGLLGRALLPRAAVQAVTLAAAQPVNLEYDLAQGDAGRRDQAIADLLVEITGAEAALAVNTSAAALMLAVNAVAAGRPVVISSHDASNPVAGPALGDLVSRSGGLVRHASPGAGTDAQSYATAIGDDAALVLRIHAGTSAEATDCDREAVRELVSAAHARGAVVLEVLANGSLVSLGRYGLSGEPVVSDRLALGLDLVVFGGDTSVGGPQAGLVAGSSALIRRMTRSPLHHAVRCGKLTIAALEGTLRLYREAADIVHEIPALRALTRPIAEIEDTARRAMPALTSALGVGFRVVLKESVSRVSSESGAGELSTVAIGIEHDYMGAHRIAGRFRQARPPIIGRVEDDWFLLDVRTVFDPLDLVPNWTDELEEPARYPL